MSDDFRSNVDRVLGTAAKWFGIYVQLIFALAAIGVGVAIVQALIFGPNREPQSPPAAHSEQAPGLERSSPDRPYAPPR